MQAATYSIPDVLGDITVFPPVWKSIVSAAGRILLIPSECYTDLRTPTRADTTLEDLTTRKGLRRAHKHFDELYERLDSAFDSACVRHNSQEMGGVLGLMTQMCVDNILRDMLINKGRKILSAHTS